MSVNIKLAAVPNFPLPSQQYSPESIIKLENVLRLYLNLLTTITNEDTIDISNNDTMNWLGGWNC